MLTAVHSLDIDLRDGVRSELDSDPGVTSGSVIVSVRDGVVTLTGTVPDFFEKLAVGNAAKRVGGIRPIVERIDVDLGLERRRDPADVARAHDDANLGRAIADTLDLDGFPIATVQDIVRNGHVTLEGSVWWDARRRDAGTAVLRIQGVRGLSNKIVVRSPFGATYLR